MKKQYTRMEVINLLHTLNTEKGKYPIKKLLISRWLDKKEEKK